MGPDLSPCQKVASPSPRAALICSGPGMPPHGPAVSYDANSADTELPELQHRSVITPSGLNVSSSVTAPGSPPGQGWRHLVPSGACHRPQQPLPHCLGSNIIAAHCSRLRSAPVTPLARPHRSPQLRAITNPRRGYMVRIIVEPERSGSVTRPPSLLIRPCPLFEAYSS
ncbi:hypothetical protein NDU88_004759 [Pleurodeles waltl]|uniref:Uncharacterized protein n=1 Tax=Pleurodeles waltl TaxID=8319 RepID=A0AAV7SJQ2_PLEWA|nr:hypothetical protein NDU88_004759 [Pleurodeles waltl]